VLTGRLAVMGIVSKFASECFHQPSSPPPHPGQEEKPLFLLSKNSNRAESVQFAIGEGLLLTDLYALPNELTISKSRSRVNGVRFRRSKYHIWGGKNECSLSSATLYPQESCIAWAVTARLSSQQATKPKKLRSPPIGATCLNMSRDSSASRRTPVLIT